MSDAVVAGPDEEGIGDALAAEGVGVSRLEGVLTADRLEEAGVADAELYVLTNLEEATSVPVVRELNPEIRIVVYDRASLPEFVTAQVDIAVDPDLLGPAVVAEELSTE